ncbi:MAG: DNA-binding response regulator [Gammaproteobacteria bacterium HGW-Gammaproteobacteria-11]|nr:MAG: DNA-binding response regulator [Gammaproteobacteria bacterium HGW-Gammaproteobacteria-11]
MTQDFFITDAQTLSPRWQQCFPLARIVNSVADLPAAGSNCRAWYLADKVPDWTVQVTELCRLQFTVIVMTRAASFNQLTDSLGAGARGYVDAFANREILGQVAQSVSAGALWLPAEVVSSVVGALNRHTRSETSQQQHDIALARLTGREREVVEALRQGLTNKQIAIQLDISPRTVKEHLGSVFAKLGVSDRLQLALLFNSHQQTDRTPS